MKKHNIRTAVLSCLALVLVMSVHVAPSLSYFTTYVRAEGGYPIHLRLVDTDVDESYDLSGEKQITIRNTGDADCYVRVRVIAGQLIGLDIHGDGWTPSDDGYWYYDRILHPNESANVLYAKITRDAKLTDQDYNVVVIEECTPVQYGEDGQPYADWTMAVNGGN